MEQAAAKRPRRSSGSTGTGAGHHHHGHAVLHSERASTARLARPTLVAATAPPLRRRIRPQLCRFRSLTAAALAPPTLGGSTSNPSSSRVSLPQGVSRLTQLSDGIHSSERRPLAISERPLSVVTIRLTRTHTATRFGSAGVLGYW
jgi:hypothetical protein